MTRSYQANAKAVMMLQKPLERADQLSSQLNMSAASGWARQAGTGENIETERENNSLKTNKNENKNGSLRVLAHI